VLAILLCYQTSRPARTSFTAAQRAGDLVRGVVFEEPAEHLGTTSGIS